MLSILIALVIFLLVVLFHEGGHFFSAKLCGIKVNEFSIGMGPAFWQKEEKDTLYSIRVIPLGGYCAMEGEDEHSSSPDSFDQASVGKRFLTIFAGPLMNIFVAIVFFIIYMLMVGRPIPVVSSFAEQSPVEAVGMEKGDEIIAINYVDLEDFDQLKKTVQENEDKEMVLSVLKKTGKREEYVVRPIKDMGQYYLGFQPESKIDILYSVKAGFIMTFQIFFSLIQFLGQLFRGGIDFQAVSGPIGVIQTIGEAYKLGFSKLVFYAGYISVNLAFFNLLPIPALDGSKLLLLILEKIRGKALDKSLETKITLVGFIFLLALIFIVSIKDVMKLIGG